MWAHTEGGVPRAEPPAAVSAHFRTNAVQISCVKVCRVGRERRAGVLA
jgi:hypothetical protein